MDDPSRAGAHLARDPCLYPMDPMEMSCFDIRAAHMPAAPRRSQDTAIRSAKRKATSSPPHISLKATSRTHVQPSQLDQKACSDVEPDLWILPDFDDWALENDSSTHGNGNPPAAKPGNWAPLVKRAVNSNRERLRRRLEGDGWDFVGGKYGEQDAAIKEEAEASEASQESVDDEFDVVVLPVAG